MKNGKGMFAAINLPTFAFDKPGEGEDDSAAKAAAEAATKAAEEAAATKAAEEAAAAEAAEKAAADKAEKDAVDAAAAAKKAAEENADNPEFAKIAEEKAALVREVMEKKQKIADASKENESLKALLAEFGDVDPSKIREMLDAEKKAERDALEAAGEFTRLKEMMAAEHKRDMEAKDAEIEELRNSKAKSDDDIDKLTVGQSFASSKFIGEKLILTPAKARVIWGSHVELKDGNVVVYDKPASDKTRSVLVDSSGNPVDFETGMQKLVEADPEKDTLIKSKQAPGASSKSQVPGGVVKSKKGDGLYGAARIAASLSNSGT